MSSQGLHAGTLWLTLRSLLWVFLLPGLVVGYLPWRYFGLRRVLLDLGDPLHWTGLAGILAGAIGLGLSVWEFARTGRGTLSPAEPPRLLVVRGLYRYVRNPMYLSVTAILLGEVLLARSWTLLGYWAVWFAAANAFVMGYEEPRLRHQFGPAYVHYTKAVGRWLPRLQPYDASG